MLFTTSTQVSNGFIDTYTPNTGTVAFNESGYGDVAVQNTGSNGQKTFCFSYSLADLVDGVSPSTRNDLVTAIVNYLDFGTPPTPGFLGDINGDDNCNSTDVLIILSFDAGLTIPPDFLARINAGYGDVNSDGPTNSTDALIILSFDAGISVPFPVCEPFVPNAPTNHNKSDNSIGRIEVTAHPVSAEIKKRDDSGYTC